MIPASQPHEARYKHEDDGHVHFTEKPVIAWSDDGEPLVVDGTRLVPAHRWNNFHDVVPCSPPIVTALPADGWHVEYKDDDGSTYTSPVTAWLVRSDGSCTAIDTDATGYSDEPTTCSNFVRLVPPDAVETT